MPDAISIIGIIIALVGAIAALVVIPEVRKWLRLDHTSQKIILAGKVKHDNNKPLITASPSQAEASYSLVKEITQDDNSLPLFQSGNPLPSGFQLIKPGTRVSVLLAIFSSNQLWFVTLGYILSIEEGLFTSVAYPLVRLDVTDPEIESVFFLFRDTAAKEYVKKQAITVFGTEKMLTRLMGEIIEWRDIEGYILTIDSNHLTVRKMEQKS